MLTLAVGVVMAVGLFKCHQCSGRPFKVNESKMQAVEIYFLKSVQLKIYSCFF
jgi:hypothetical protein